MKPTIYIKTTENVKLSDVFENGLIPNNINLDKTITGNGLTTAEITAKRNSIIINPQVNTISTKFDEWIMKGYNVFSIYHEVGDDVVKFLKSETTNKKIFVTPESFPILIYKAREAGLLKTLQEDFFCLIDESHCFASEKFRKMILNPINYVFDFKNIALGSATPFPYTDPRVLALQKYKIVYKGVRGKIKIISSKSPSKAIEELIKRNGFIGNVHIFFNSVIACGRIVRNTGITDVSIYCADEEDNMTKLFDVAKYYKRQPKEGEFKRFNLYSCRYIEGWDMVDDENATIIIVTDTGISHSLISIPIKAVQCIGRLRDKQPIDILHITNDYGKEKHEEQSFNQIERRIMFEAVSFIKMYKQHRNNMIKANIPHTSMMDDFISEYSDREFGLPELAHFKISQLIYKDWARSDYANIRTIVEAWQSANYSTELYKWEIDVKQPTDTNSRSINKYIIEQFQEFKNNPTKYKYGTASQIVKKLERKYNLLLQAVLLLGIERIKELEYDNDRMKQEFIVQNNTNAQVKIAVELDKILKVGGKYLKPLLKETLQQLFDKYQYLDSNGKVMKAKANLLEDELKLYKIKDDRINDGNGKRQAGFKIIEKYFDMKVAA